MTDHTKAAPQEPHKHCWHDTGRLLISDPPQAVQVCCWCGEEIALRIKRLVPKGIHGSHSPDAIKSLTFVSANIDTSSNLTVQTKNASARVANGVAAIPSVDEVTAKEQSSAAPTQDELANSYIQTTTIKPGKYGVAPVSWACDWTEDYVHENGRYFNTCVSCGKQFYGHKRRVTCRVCANAAPEGRR